MNNESSFSVIVVGGGAAGLAAAEVLSARGQRVLLLEGGRRPGNKFLVAGRSGLNLTLDTVAARVIEAVSKDINGLPNHAIASHLGPCVEAFDPKAIRAWASDLATPTLVGSSGKVFPAEHHGAGLLQRWQQRLEQQGVVLRCNQLVTAVHRLPDGLWQVQAAEIFTAPRVILALGGGSWTQTGSTGAWQSWLSELGVAIEPLQSANCGVNIPWDQRIIESHQGTAFKNIHLSHGKATSHGEVVITANGLEGYAVYPLVPSLRAPLAADGQTEIFLDLARDRSQEQVLKRLQGVRKGASFSVRLRSALRLSPAAIALLYYAGAGALRQDFPSLATLIKACPLPVIGLRPLDEAISSAGGVSLSALDKNFQIKAHPGLYAIGEMVDWEAPTGGYLLSVCMAMGRWTGLSITP